MPEKKDRKLALVIIDVQKKFTGGSISEEGNLDSVATINRAVASFHKNKRPVIFVHYDGPCECSLYEKDDGDEYIQGIISDPRNIIVHKTRMNSFVGTKLADVVKECKCDSILLAGLVTQYCIIGTYYGSFEHNISPYLLIGGTISTDNKFDNAAYTICKTFTMDELEENLSTTKIPEFTICGSEYPCCEIINK
ncbi:MAG: isochorismatase family protein [Candidatus Methanogranum gryphiswaldense]|nr:MAG: isochorismatase family protein [Candidatus Methanogranum sp. U3.2.1]